MLAILQCVNRSLPILQSYAPSFGALLHLQCKMSSESKPSIYITRRIPNEAMKQLQSSGCSIRQWDSDSPVPRDELLKNVAGVDGLFCLLTDKIDKAVLDQAGPGLKVVSTMSVGYNHVDIKECQKRNIPVGFTPDVLTDATAELTIALLLMTSRRLLEAAEQVKSGGWGSWVPLWMCGPGLSGSTIGILGLGRIGAAVGERLLSFRVSKILYSSRSPNEETAAKLGAEFVSFDKLLKESDFLIVSCALTNETRHLFNAQTFKMMKKSAILINTSRGDVIKQDDLYSALVDGEIAAAGLDVTTPEPLPTDDPLLTLSNCVVLPHVGSATVETRTSMAVLAAKNLLAGLNNQPLVAQVEVS